MPIPENPDQPGKAGDPGDASRSQSEAADTARLDALERLADAGTFALLLHDGSAKCGSFAGLAFGRGHVRRTLRQALDQFRGAPETRTIEGSREMPRRGPKIGPMPEG